MTPIFDFRSYRKFLLAWISHQSQGGRGVRKRMSESCGFQNSFLTLVLNGKAELSADQAFRVGQFIGLLDSEVSFFLLLVQRARATEPQLKNHLDQEMHRILENRKDLKNRLTNPKITEGQGLQKYFSSWIYMAIHLGILTSEYSNVEKLSDRLGLPQVLVQSTLRELEQMGLIEFRKGEFSSGQAQMHLPKDSPWQKSFQLSLKAKIMDEIQRGSQGLHFSSIVTLSKNDYDRIMEILIRQTDELRVTIMGSPANEIYMLNLDFFPLG